MRRRSVDLSAQMNAQKDCSAAVVQAGMRGREARRSTREEAGRQAQQATLREYERQQAAQTIQVSLHRACCDPFVNCMVLQDSNLDLGHVAQLSTALKHIHAESTGRRV